MRGGRCPLVRIAIQPLDSFHRNLPMERAGRLARPASAQGLGARTGGVGHAGYSESRGRPAERGRRLVPAGGRSARFCHARRLRLSGGRHGSPQEPGQRAVQDPGRFRHLHRCLLLHRLHHRLRRLLLRQRRGAQWRGERLRPARPDARQVLLPLHLCRRSAGHRLGRHRRAREVQLAVRRHRADRRPRLSLLRGHRLEQELRPAGRLLQGRAGRGVSRLRRLDCRARGRRLDRLLRRAPARPPARAL